MQHLGPCIESTLLHFDYVGEEKKRCARTHSLYLSLQEGERRFQEAIARKKIRLDR